MGIFDSIVCKKYLLGATKNADGSELYGELFTQPTAQSLEIAERLAAARAAGVGEAEAVKDREEKDKLTPSVAKSAIPADEPRVEELPADEKKPEQ